MSVTSSSQSLSYGVATSSYQIEGATEADGRGPSIWDTFTARPGTIADGSDGSVACDSYHRLDDDLALIERLGVKWYRFSIAWPRVQPTGSGPVNTHGLDYYDRVVDGLLERGVTPAPTLYHWDLPQPLEDAGGWPVRDTAERFADYAAVVAERLGDRVRTWTTLNEPWCTAFLGYAAGVHAPGRREPEAALAAAHHTLLGHGLAAQALRAAVPGAQIGIVLNLAPVHLDDPAAAEAAEVVDAIQNGIWLDPLLDGRYPRTLVDRCAALGDPTVVRPGDLDTIRGTLDWLGINYYTPYRIGRPTSEGGGGATQDTGAYPTAPPFAFVPRDPRTAMGWEVDASGLETLLRTVAARAPGMTLRITENGAAFADGTRDAAGVVDDQDRIAYLRDHIAAVERARAAGVPVTDYFAWSLLDNFEWAEGYRKRFGIVAIEPATLRRVPKRSYDWFAQHIARSRG